MDYRKPGYIALALLLIFSILFSCKSDADSQVQKSLDIFATLQQNLQSQLKAAIQSGGPVKAIATCNTIGPEMESSLSKDGVIVRRVSTRPRNPGHQPDKTELAVLEKWAQMKSEGQELPDFTKQSGSAGTYIMKPIMIGKEVCLKCHGNPESMSTELKAQIAKLYPEDQATGYQKGDLRGAFVAIWQ